MGDAEMTELDDIKKKLVGLTLPQKLRLAATLIEQGHVTYMQMKELLKADASKGR
jgi:hypothetical protein